MRLLQFFAAFAFLVSVSFIDSANAETRCGTDSFGNTTCRDNSATLYEAKPILSVIQPIGKLPKSRM